MSIVRLDTAAAKAMVASGPLRITYVPTLMVVHTTGKTQLYQGQQSVLQWLSTMFGTTASQYAAPPPTSAYPQPPMPYGGDDIRPSLTPRPGNPVGGVWNPVQGQRPNWQSTYANPNLPPAMSGALVPPTPPPAPVEEEDIPEGVTPIGGSKSRPEGGKRPLIKKGKKKKSAQPTMEIFDPEEENSNGHGGRPPRPGVQETGYVDARTARGNAIRPKMGASNKGLMAAAAQMAADRMTKLKGMYGEFNEETKG